MLLPLGVLTAVEGPYGAVGVVGASPFNFPGSATLLSLHDGGCVFQVPVLTSRTVGRKGGTQTATSSFAAHAHGVMPCLQVLMTPMRSQRQQSLC
jgi:hypothetical protein